MSKPFQSLKGQLLLDGGELGGSFFQRTVVLICEHNAEGAFGLILNRVMESKVGEMVVADLPDRLCEEPLYLARRKIYSDRKPTKRTPVIPSTPEPPQGLSLHDSWCLPVIKSVPEKDSKKPEAVRRSVG